MAAALRLVVHELKLSALQLAHLHMLKAPAAPPRYDINDYARTCYTSSRQLGGRGLGNPRMALSQGEEGRVLGSSEPAQDAPYWLRKPSFQLITIPPCPVPDSIVPDAEQQLSSLVVLSKPPPSLPPYPLGTGSAVPLEESMHSELEASWAAHHSLPVPEAVVPGALSAIEKLLVGGAVRLGCSVTASSLCQPCFAVHVWGCDAG